ncbi:MAG: hypothetical protein ACXVP1_06845, partial [Thermoleophilia bacterium]
MAAVRVRRQVIRAQEVEPMKKRLLATALATAIVLAVAPLALAATHHGSSSAKAAKATKHKPFLCKGSVVSVDATADTLVV